MKARERKATEGGKTGKESGKEGKGKQRKGGKG